MRLTKLQVLMWFGLGLVSGAVLMGSWFRFHWGHPPPPPDPEHVIQMFAQGLNLSPEQYAGLRTVILKNDGRFREQEAKMQAFRETVQNDIRKLLNAKQQAEFDRRMAEQEAHWKRGPGAR